jgi:hypothetical protein
MEPVFQQFWVDLAGGSASVDSTSTVFVASSCKTRSISSGWVRFRLMAHSLSNHFKEATCDATVF